VDPSALSTRTAPPKGSSSPDDLRRFVAHVISAGDLERARVAHALHESTAQNLSAIVMQIGALLGQEPDAERQRRLGLVRDLARETLEEVRLLSHTMYPRSLDDLGLLEALRQLGRSVSIPEVPVHVHGDGPDVLAIPRTVRLVLYWVAQEAVTNALRHGRPAAVSVHLSAAPGGVTLAVTDDGGGFDLTEAERRRPGMGLFAMRERVALVGGALQIHSHRDGTRVVATVPLESLSAA
jgi:signal transduction histidine kinase